jgi:hypothetical protein
VSAPSEIDVAWSVQSDDWPGGLPADIRFVAPRPRTQDRHNFRETVASSAC